MRLLFTPLVALGFASALAAQPAPAPTADETKAIDFIVKAGGKADIDPTLAEGARVAAKFEAANDALLVALKKLPQVGSVDVFDATACTEKGLLALKELPHLRRLVLSKSGMTAARVTAVGQCAELRDLRLPNAGLSDAALAGLKPLARLEALDLSDNPRITDKGMASVQALERLRALYLSTTGITDAGLMELKPLDGLRTLYVSGTKVTADGAAAFTDEMPNLRAVRR